MLYSIGSRGVRKQLMMLRAQEKELQHLQRSLEALSGKPCTTTNTTQQKFHGSARSTMDASQLLSGPRQPAQSSQQQHLKQCNMGRDLWPNEDELLDLGLGSPSWQQGSAGIGQKIHGSAQPHRSAINMDPHPYQHSLPKELDSQLSFVEKRSEQHHDQPYIVTEPDSPKARSEAPAEGFGSEKLNQNAQPIVYTETTVTRWLPL